MNPTTPQTETEMIAALTASIARTKAQRAEAAKARREARKVVASFLRASKVAAKRDEFSCPCCGVGTDSSYCLACEVFECGEQDVSSPDVCLVPKNVRVSRALHAAHYEGSGNRGHDLLVVEIAIPAGQETPFNNRGEPDARPAGLPMDFRYHSGSRNAVAQVWRFIKTAPLSPGRCSRCS